MGELFPRPSPKVFTSPHQFFDPFPVVFEFGEFFGPALELVFFFGHHFGGGLGQEVFVGQFALGAGEVLAQFIDLLGEAASLLRRSR